MVLGGPEQVQEQGGGERALLPFPVCPFAHRLEEVSPIVENVCIGDDIGWGKGPRKTRLRIPQGRGSRNTRLRGPQGRGRSHHFGSGRAGSGRAGSGRAGIGRAGSGLVGFRGAPIPSLEASDELPKSRFNRILPGLHPEVDLRKRAFEIPVGGKLEASPGCSRVIDPPGGENSEGGDGCRKEGENDQPAQGDIPRPGNEQGPPHSCQEKQHRSPTQRPAGSEDSQLAAGWPVRLPIALQADADLSFPDYLLLDIFLSGQG